GEAEKLQEVSMNATIAAGHTGSHIRTFTEIARQIGGSSSRLFRKIHKVRTETNGIVNTTLDAMIIATQQSYFERALPGVTGAANIKLVRDRMMDFEIRIHGSLGLIYRDLQVIVSDLKAVEEIQKRVWAVVTRLRIEASAMDPDEQVFVASIADSLSQSIDRSSAAFDKLYETVKLFEQKLVTAPHEMEQERQYA
ncbi:MAG: hypothetical protein ACXVBE_08170, partial [Bdellovibrionota bacterium]